MTTIAWDSYTLAVDSASEASEVIIETTAKKLFLDVGKYRAVAIAGILSDMANFLFWLDGEEGDCPAFEGVAIAIGQDNKVYGFYESGKGRPFLEPKSSAQGSGFKIALGAMDAGATSIEAVKIAVKRDCYTGGRVRSFCIKEKKDEGI